jgi:integrase
MTGIPIGEPIFRTQTGGYVTYSNWLHRIWHPAMRVPVVDGAGKRLKGADGKPLWEPLLDMPLPTPHDVRHSYGSRLADGGLEIHDIMRLMGHLDLRSAQRYIHSGEKRFDRAREALMRARRR